MFLTTHYLEEADALCDRVLVIDHGRIVAEGAPEELKRRISGDAVELSLPDGEVAGRAAGLLAGLPGLGEPQLDGARVRCALPSAVDGLPRILHALDAAGIEVAGVEVRRPTLDDVFLSYTGRTIRDAEGAPGVFNPFAQTRR